MCHNRLKNTAKRSVFLFLLIAFSILSKAQDSHYYSQQPDSRGTLNGGTGTAGSRELSAVFYNPGIIALFTESNLGIGGSLYTIDFIKLSEKETTGRDLEGSNFQVKPSLIAGTFKWKKNSKLTSSYAYLNLGYYSNRISNYAVNNYVENGTSLNSVYRAEFRTRFVEDWLGSGISYRINDHWGIGFVPYVHMYTIQYMQRQYTDISVVNQQNAFVSGVQDFREARLFSPGLVFNLGIVYHKGTNEFGLTIVSPRINVKALAYSSIERTYLTYSANGQIENSAFIDPDFLAYVKRPLEINFGYASIKNDRALKLRMTYYAGYKPYTMGDVSIESFRNGIFLNENKYDFLPVTSNISLLNFGLGYEWSLKKDLRLVTGFRTDFTFFDKSQYQYFDFTTVLIHWNIYHFSAGLDWEYKRLKLNTGVDYGFSYDKNISQFANLEDIAKPIDEVGLSNAASVNHQQLKVFLGFVISF